jgi:iron complex transport system substrate-binding protein
MHTDRLLSILVAAFLVLAAAAWATGSAEPSGSASAIATANFPLTVTDDAGSSITLPAKPSRIASLTMFTDEVLLELVEPSRIVALTTFAADPAISNVVEKSKAVPTKLAMNVEILVALEPDLLFVANWTEADKVKQLRDAGIPVYLTSTGVTAGEIEAKVSHIGQLVGEPAKARTLVDAMEARLSAVEKRLAELPAGKRLSVVDYTVWGSAQGKGSSWDEIVRRAGLANGVGNIAADEWGQVPLSKEKLLEIDPDILILPGWTYDDPKGAEAFFAKTVTDPVLKALKAVREGRAYRMPENLKTATSQYLVDAVEWLAKTAYPELFE